MSVGISVTHKAESNDKYPFREVTLINVFYTWYMKEFAGYSLVELRDSCCLPFFEDEPDLL